MFTEDDVLSIRTVLQENHVSVLGVILVKETPRGNSLPNSVLFRLQNKTVWLRNASRKLLMFFDFFMNFQETSSNLVLAIFE